MGCGVGDPPNAKTILKKKKKRNVANPKLYIRAPVPNRQPREVNTFPDVDNQRRI
jgi:hypothetical protein